MKFYTDTREIEFWLKTQAQVAGRVTVNNGLVDVEGDVVFKTNMIKTSYIPVQFNHVTGNFYVNKNSNLTSLHGSPRRVDGNFGAEYCGLTTLEGGPQYVGDSLDLNGNRITNLRAAPAEVGGDFYAKRCLLHSLEGCTQKIGGSFNVADNSGLKSLVGGPKEVGFDYVVSHCDLSSLEGAALRVPADFLANSNGDLVSLVGGPRRVGGSYIVTRCNISDLTGAPDVVGDNFVCDMNYLSSLTGLSPVIGGVLSIPYHRNLPLMKVFSVRSVRKINLEAYMDDLAGDAETVQDIINQYLPTRNFMMCAARLHRSGFSANAGL